jgi:hypothetical protein
MSAGFQELLSAHLLAAGERQEVARGVIGGRRYGVDLAAGTITFADGPIIAAEMIGSASTEDGSWFWAWGNGSLGLPDDRLLASRRVAEQGAGLAVPELTEPRLARRPHRGALVGQRFDWLARLRRVLRGRRRSNRGAAESDR